VFAKKSSRGGVHRVAPMADGGGRVLMRGEEVAAFIAVRKAMRKVSLRAKGTKSWYGRGTAGWAATRGGQSPTRGGVARVRRRRLWLAGAAGVSTWRTWRGTRWRFDAGGPTAHGPAGGRLPRRSGPRGGRGERARRGAARRDVVRCGTPAQNSSKHPTSN
jgi:hypothetical protein